MKQYYLFFATFFLFAATICKAQDSPSLLDLLGDEAQTDRVTNAFKSSRAINNHSMEMLAPGALDFRILHRFGRVSDGFYELFGLDQANMRMGFDYSFLPNLTVGVGRSTTKKELDGFVKYRLLWQSTGKKNIPVSLVWVSGMTRNGLQQPFPNVEPTFVRRLGYYHSLIVGRKFNDRLTLQLAPTLVHTNYVATRDIPNDLAVLGFSGRFKLSKRIAAVWDYAHAFNRFPENAANNPLSIGVDIETGGHVFQLHFSNAVGMNERAFISDENGEWGKGQLQFGFNLSRVFQLKKNKVD